MENEPSDKRCEILNQTSIIPLIFSLTNKHNKHSLKNNKPQYLHKNTISDKFFKAIYQYVIKLWYLIKASFSFDENSFNQK